MKNGIMEKLLVIPFNKPQMVVISLLVIQSLSEMVILMSGWSRQAQMEMNNGIRHMVAANLIMVIPFNRPLMVGLLLLEEQVLMEMVIMMSG